MGCFELLPQVLAALERQIPGTKTERTALILHHLQETLDYKKLSDRDRPVIDYGDPAVRLAYIFKYVTAHAMLVAGVVEGSRVVSDILKSKEYPTVVSLGGGPGSEVIGLMQWLDSQPKTKLVAKLLDREPAWSDDWTNVWSAFQLPVTATSVSMDVFDGKSWKKFPDMLSSADIVTMVFFLSELYADREKMAPFCEFLGQRMMPGAAILFVDNLWEECSAWLELQMCQHGLKTVERGDEAQWRMPTKEQVSDLGDYAKRFSFSPKLTGRVSWRVLQKQEK